ncbi:MAG: 4'-phosphopantetheinyl transferase superfamily protein [Silvanigrellaceae bacterium]|nr:4'-phosphopantetheinyl transferase superfamily protein [Silvanigrellaceae bacterium]
MIINFPEIELNKSNALIFTAYLPSLHENLPFLWGSLSIQEKTQAKKFINSYLSERYIISHGLLRHLLAFYTKKDPQTIAYKNNQYGKPFLKNSRSKIQFNMSHSKDYAAYILALGCEVGIDIEWKNKDIDVPELSSLVLTENESTLFNELSSDKKLNAFYEVWTKKEAILKAFGQGLSYPMNQIEIMSIIDNSRAHYIANNIKFYCPKLINLNSYAGAVAIASEERELIQTNLIN